MTEARSRWLKANADRVRYYKRKSAKKAYAANPLKFSRRQKAWRKSHPVEVRLRDARYARKYAAERRKLFSIWRKAHPEYFRARAKAEVVNLADWYVRERLSRRTIIKPADWPTSIVEAQKANIRLKRLWRNQALSTN